MSTGGQFERGRLRFLTCGAVDDGKSTLVGRLLLDCGAVADDVLAEARRSSGGLLDLSFLTDGLEAERSQGITIDVAYRYFATAHRAFQIADAPGHAQYTRYMAAAASQSQLALLAVSAVGGVQSETRRHLAVAALFGVRDVIVCVTKMDQIGRDRSTFLALAHEIRQLAAMLDVAVVAVVPTVALDGDNVVARSAAMPWYDGPTILAALEAFDGPRNAALTAVLPVAHVSRIAGGGRLILGELASGLLKRGARVFSDNASAAAVTELFVSGAPRDYARAGDAVALRMVPEIDAGRGTVLSTVAQPAAATQVRARLVWFVDARADRTIDILAGTARRRVVSMRIEEFVALDRVELGNADRTAVANDIVLARITLAEPMPLAPYAEQAVLGSLMLVDRSTRETVAGGVVVSIERRRGDTPLQTLSVSSEQRARRLGQRPVVIWLTGLSGAGKSTLADLLDRRLFSLGRQTVVLDGDNLRNGLTSDLGFSDDDRRENVRRVAAVAGLMADAGLIVIVSLISPFRVDREAARQAIGADRFVEVFVDAPLEVCRARDPKGHYARVSAGEMLRFTGVASPYEPPMQPDVHVRTVSEAPDSCVQRILQIVDHRDVMLKDTLPPL